MKGFLTIFATWALSVGLVSAVDITFMDGVGCSGYGVSGSSSIPSVSCYNVTAWDSFQSVDIRNFGPNQVVRFFADDECLDETYSANGETCYGANDIAAFTVQNITTAATAQSEEVTTTDVVPYNMKLSDYRGLSVQPSVAAIPLSNFAIAVLALVTATALNMRSMVNTCINAAGTGQPVDIFDCIAGPAATVLTYVAAYFFDRQGRRAQGHIDVALGQIVEGGRKRDVAHLTSMANANYMHDMMNVTNSPATHNGRFMTRDLDGVEYTSPIYEILGPRDGINYHFTAFWDSTTSSFIHHMAPDHDVIVKRQDNYNDIRYAQNGLDFSYCPRNVGQSVAVFDQDIETMYDTIFRDFECSIGRDELFNSNQLVVDLYNRNSVLVGEVHMAPYKSGGPNNNNRYVITQCTDRHASVNQACIN